jgi:LacI family transcriptional regulator
MVTRNDVARHAGTSTAVVSYVVNDGPRPVAPETRARVLAAVAELGYRPNAIARSLRGARSNTIGVLLEDHGRRSTALLAGADTVAAEHDITLVVGVGRPTDDGPARQLRSFVDRQADGLLLLTRTFNADVLSELARAKTPSIEVFPIAANDTFDAFADEPAALEVLVAHLAGHERRALLFAVSTDDEASATVHTSIGDRPEGPTVRADDEHVGRAVVEALVAGTVVDAVVCSSVATALAVERALHMAGRGSVGHPALAALSDDLHDRHAAIFGITVVAHPWEQIGALAANVLLDRVRDPTTDALPTPTVAPQVQCRASCRSWHERAGILADDRRSSQQA